MSELQNIDYKQLADVRKKVLEKIFSRMNTKQKEAVFHVEGPLLILAGAGSGKTTVLVNRIANLISYGNAYNSENFAFTPTQRDIDNLLGFLNDECELDFETKDLLSYNAARPWQILAITFTNKAANELKERLSSMLGEEDARDIWASTFHSCCAKILRRYADRIGYDNSFTIYDTDDTKRLIKECQKRLDIDDKRLSHKTILNEISSAKNHLITPVEYRRVADEGGNANPLIAKVYEIYQQELQKADAMDFDDLIFKTVELLEQQADVREYYQRKFKYVMVDEYQDTNYAQFRLTELLASGYGNLCVVGDDDQSIYKFRGATIENILGFESQFNKCKVIKLEQNYRSTQNILDAANAVIAHNEKRKGKELWTANGSGEKITSYFALDAGDEAEYIADEIVKGVMDNGMKHSDFAVLYRANAQSMFIEKALVRKGIPYRIFGGHRFYERAEIRDSMAYLTVLNNPGDNIRLSRIINVPARGIGQTTVNYVSEIAAAQGISMFEVICHADEYARLQRSAQKLKKFAMMIMQLRDFVDEIPIDKLFEKVLSATEYFEYLAGDKEKGQEKTENVQQLLVNLKQFCEENEDEATLQNFLEEVALMTDIDNYNDQSDAVVLMTIHSAKGLEFPTVFLPGFEEGVFPSSMCMYDAAEVEEERRLAYVAITRAKNKLHIINAFQRAIFGNESCNRPSRFLTEIPAHLLDRKKSKKENTSFGFGNSATFGGRRYDDLPFYDGYDARPAASKKPVVKRAPVAPAPKVEYKVGDRVKGTYGEGTIISVKPIARDTIIEVMFDTAGTKRFMGNSAKLIKL